MLNAAKTPPFFIEDGIEIDESIRLKYRYLDLRRPEMQKTLMLRSKAAKIFRDFLDEQGFIEVETPILTKSTPEGARDYLVPSRVHPGEFFALPQSPQIFKQLLMVGGMERYYQIARCFRDEDLACGPSAGIYPGGHRDFVHVAGSAAGDDGGADRAACSRKRSAWRSERPFQRITYADAMGKYGSDKPDLRFGLELVDLTDLVANSGVKVFATVAAEGRSGQGAECQRLRQPGAARRSTICCRSLPVTAAKGLAWIQVKDGE